MDEASRCSPIASHAALPVPVPLAALSKALSAPAVNAAGRKLRGLRAAACADAVGKRVGRAVASRPTDGGVVEGTPGDNESGESPLRHGVEAPRSPPRCKRLSRGVEEDVAGS